ncbi:MAG: class I SAM-dependent methyltransferase [Flavobacteriales bacterium]|nr:class I SAM-dependent methyltransferase [Flavobacteriales bacterium]MEB2342902.1 class I SAM-dependent methyltransferase [Flavobacteriia bacterium]
MPLVRHAMLAYARHLLTAGNRYDVHSPFVYRLITDVLRRKTMPGVHSDLEALRGEMESRTDSIQVTDFGAGSHQLRGTEREVASIARTSLKPRRQAAQLAGIAHYFEPQTVVELGTSLGITTLYLARAAPMAQVHTLEGCPNIAAIAAGNFARMGAGNIELHTGPFTQQLPQVLARIDRLDLAFIDGHHSAAPTLDYFGQCLAKAHEGSVFILDDIHWSADMEHAWTLVQEHPKVVITIDLFHFGLVFFRNGQQREHFKLRY